MPMSGGAAAKAGGWYEEAWVLYWLTRILAREAQSLVWEVLGPGGDGVEFQVVLADRVEVHQAKRGNRTDGRWTLKHLRDLQVLSHMATHLQNPDVHFVFVSEHAAAELQELADRARATTTLATFRNDGLKAGHHELFGKLCGYWGNCDAEVALGHLKRTWVEVGSHELITDLAWARLARWFVDPSTAAAALMNHARDHLHEALTPHRLWRLLEHQPRVLLDPGHQPLALRALEVLEAHMPRLDTGLGSLAPLRAATQGVEDAWGTGAREVVLTGPAGSGKSAVALDLIEAKRRAGWPVLALPAGLLRGSHPQALGASLGLPFSPEKVLGDLAGDGPCLLVVDQLQALGDLAPQREEVAPALRRLLEQSRLVPHLHLLLVCREGGPQGPPDVRDLLDAGAAPRVHVAPLAREEVRAILEAAGVPQLWRLAPHQWAVLGNPLLLRLFLQSRRPGDPPPGFLCAYDLLQAYWTNLHRTVVEYGGVAIGARWREAAFALCAELQRCQTPHVPVARLEPYALELDVLASLGVVRHAVVGTQNRCGFVHEALRDFIAARAFLASGESLGELIARADQRLAVRPRVREILTHLRADDPAKHLGELRALLRGPTVRVHLREVALTHLLQVDQPSDDEEKLAIETLKEPGPLRAQAWRLLCSAPAWFDALHARSVWATWIASSPELQPELTALLQGLIKARPDEVCALLGPLIETRAWPDANLARILSAAPLWRHRLLFDRLLRALDVGVWDERLLDPMPFTGLGFLFQDLARHQPGWACEALERFLLRATVVYARECPTIQPLDPRAGVRIRGSDWDTVVRLAGTVPTPFLERVAPALGVPQGGPAPGAIDRESLGAALVAGAGVAQRILELDDPWKAEVLVRSALAWPQRGPSWATPDNPTAELNAGCSPDGPGAGDPLAALDPQALTDAQWHEVFARPAVAAHAPVWLQRFRTFARKQPGRAARVLATQPDAARPEYMVDFLESLLLFPAPLSCTALLTLLERAHERFAVLCARPVASLLGRIHDPALLERVAPLLIWHALHASGPAQPEPLDSASWLLSGARDTARGAAALGMARLMSALPQSRDYFVVALGQLVLEASPGLRACAAAGLVALWDHDPPQARRLLRELCAGPDDLVLATSDVQDLLLTAATEEGPGQQELNRVLWRMLRSAHPEVAGAGAALVCGRALLQGRPTALVQACCRGPVTWRRGAASALAGGVRGGLVQGPWLPVWRRLLNDRHEDVRAEAAEAFAFLAPDDWATMQAVVYAFCRSRAFEDHVRPLIWSWVQAGPPPADMACAVGERLVRTCAADLRSPYSVLAGHMDLLGQLVARLSETTALAQERQRCLALLDTLLALNIRVLQNMEESGERFVAASAP